MTVAELIEKLKEMPQDLPVIIESFYSDPEEANKAYVEDYSEYSYWNNNELVKNPKEVVVIQ